MSAFDKTDHDTNLDALLSTDKAEYLTLNKNKCVFARNLIGFLGTEFRIAKLNQTLSDLNHYKNPFT